MLRYLLLLLLALPALARADPVILVVGDSISAGFGIPVQQGWVALLQQEVKKDVPQAQVVNASISGDTTVGGLNRLPALLQQHQPDLTIIELGGNDGLRGMPLQRIRGNLQRMIALSRQAGSDVLLLGMQIPPNYGARYSEGFRTLFTSLSEQENTLLVPFLLDGVATRPELMQADGIHPQAAAQPQMMNAVLPLILDWLETQ
ncbi:MAG: arylesterase [Pseudomonadota bacterium]|nr:arylesterase [Pseudomonadota bacterium]